MTTSNFKLLHIHFKLSDVTESLQQLMISNYPKLDTFPQINGDMDCLRQLSLNSTGITEVPSSIGNLSGLTELNLTGCEDLVSLPDSICNLMNLQRLSLRGCKKLEKLPENICDLQELDMLEDLGSLHSFEKLDVSGSNISCLPKSFKGLLHLRSLDVQFCQNLNELPSGELPPNLMLLFADYHLALKSIRDLVNNCLKLYRLVISDCGAVSTEQVNVFLQHFLRTCIQCDFHQRDYFVIFFPDQDRISELFDYVCHFINQEKMSIDLNLSWYTNKFMGFWICFGPTALDTRLEATLVCKSDPERKYSLKYNNIHQYWGSIDHFIYCVYIPFETLWNASGNKEGKNPNDYYMLEFSQQFLSEKELCWGICLVYEKEAMSDTVHKKK